MAFAADDWISPERYLELERRAETKSEYYSGRIFAMAGASVDHNAISANLMREFSTRLYGGPCTPYPGDMRVKVSESGLYTYPDLVVVCGKPQLEDRELDTLLNPTLLVEVLSPSTEHYDRGAKFGFYRGLDSLREYLLVAQDRPHAELYVRRGEKWELTVVDGLEAELTLETVPGPIPMSRLYYRVDLPETLPVGTHPG